MPICPDCGVEMCKAYVIARGESSGGVWFCDCQAPFNLVHAARQQEVEQPENSAARALLEECAVELRHAQVFIETREKMHPTGRELYKELRQRVEKYTARTLPSGTQQPQTKTEPCDHKDFEHDVKNGQIICLGCGEPL